MTAYVITGLLGLGLLAVMAAAYHSIDRMQLEYRANRGRFVGRVLTAPVLFVIVAVFMRFYGANYAPAGLLCLFLAWLAVVFWGEV
jgi:hypothetical protein